MRIIPNTGTAPAAGDIGLRSYPTLPAVHHLPLKERPVALGKERHKLSQIRNRRLGTSIAFVDIDRPLISADEPSIPQHAGFGTRRNDHFAGQFLESSRHSRRTDNSTHQNTCPIVIALTVVRAQILLVDPCGSQSFLVASEAARADLPVIRFNRIPSVPAAIGAATNSIGTQKAARRRESMCRPSTMPLTFAINPAVAAPSAIPACWTVATDAAAMVSSPGLAPLMTRCAIKAHEAPMPMPIRPIAGIRPTTGPGTISAQRYQKGLRS